MIAVDFLVRGIRQLVNPCGSGPARGEALKSLRYTSGAWIGARLGRIVFVGTGEEFARVCASTADAEEIDGSSFVAMPGLVDPHTHLPFAGSRQDEFSQKLQGITYQEIAARGGGIMKTVSSTRQATSVELLAACVKRVDEMLLSGTTLAEAKSGYGLDKETEIKQLEVVRQLAAFHPLELVPTYMGAHEVPEEFHGRPREYLDYIIREVAPEVRKLNLAEYTDIFCEDGYFSLVDAADYLERAKKIGFKLKVHADEFTSNGAAALAVETGAASAEHLIAITDAEIDRLAPSATAAVLLPGVSFFLRLGKYAPARRLIAKNAIVALGTDFNPGSSMISSLLFIFWLAVFQLGLTIEEALNAITINSAYAVGREKQAGSVDVGKSMDLLLLDIPDIEYLAYHPGCNPIHTVIKSGRVVVKDFCLCGKENKKGE